MRKLLVLLFAASAALFAQGADEALRKRIVETAQQYKGVPYVYGAESPSAFDCSGFVHYVYQKAADLSLPRNSREQWAAGSPVKMDAARAGDVLVFDTTGAGPSHVAIFLGDGKLIHAVSEGPVTGVIVSALTDRYFGPRLLGARLFLAAAPANVASAATSAAASATKTAPETAPPSPAPSARASASAPAPALGAPSPAAPAATSKAVSAIAQIGFDIPAKKVAYADKIPAATGTRLAFTLRNATGKDGRFVVIFYKANKDFSKSTEIHRELAAIPKGGSLEIPPFLFAEAGVYKLIVKDNWNEQLVERVFKVVDVKR